MKTRDKNLISQLVSGLDLRAAALIITLYGDVVVPRGGALWTGSVIDVCSWFGINESPVRTALSRLVAARRLFGERIGRRSYYRLAPEAQREFDQATRLLYVTDTPAQGWQILYAPGLPEDDARRMRMGHLGGRVYIRPDRGQPLPEGAIGFHAPDPEQLSNLGQFWDLSDLDAGYRDMMQRFGKIKAAGPFPDAVAFTVRLLLVHVYRSVLLRDPRLPAVALPPDWQGARARALFRELYQSLSPAAERHIAGHLEGEDGFLPAQATGEHIIPVA